LALRLPGVNMASLHLICHGGLHLRTVKFPVFETGFWDLSESDAASLEGGMLFLHETKSRQSYFGGRVQAHRVAGPGEEMPGRIVFTVESTIEGKGAPWAGASHAMAWSGGLVL
jgi:hypothetical protein